MSEIIRDKSHCCWLLYSHSTSMLRYRLPSCRSIRILIIRMSAVDPWMLFVGLLPQEADRRCDFVGVDGVNLAGVESLIGGDVSTSRQDTDGDLICCSRRKRSVRKWLHSRSSEKRRRKKCLKSICLMSNGGLPWWVLTAGCWQVSGSQHGCHCHQPGWSEKCSGCRHTKIHKGNQAEAANKSCAHWGLHPVNHLLYDLLENRETNIQLCLTQSKY